MRTVKIRCSFCKIVFNRSVAEFNRNERLGRKQYCSLQCIGSSSGTWVPKNKDSVLNFGGKIYIRKPDLLSPFRYFVRSTKERFLGHSGRCSLLKKFNLTAEILKEQWDSQRGACPYTGWKLILPPNGYKWEDTNFLHHASIDRINPDIGYVQGNVQFVCPMSNWGKNIFTDFDLLKFCKDVVQYVYMPNDKPLSLPDAMFKRYLCLARRRRKEDFNLSIEDVKRQWSIQNGRCRYSGWKLISPKNTSECECMKLTPERASLDRIDSSKGYIPENIQFVCVMANYAKNKFSSSDLIEFCTAVARNNKSA